jgi:Uma2 family endonuclease
VGERTLEEHQSVSISTPRAESRVLLYNVSWATFQSLAREARGGRLAYDRGTLEIMSPSFEHENVNGLVGRLIEIFAEELDVDVTSAGSTTLSRPDLDRSIEADECYYIAGAATMRGKNEIELPLDPPPDLAIEVDISSSSINKLGICAKLGIAEVWRYDGKKVVPYVLQDDGQYALSGASYVLPRFPLDELNRLLDTRGSQSENAIARSFRTWIRQHLLGD